MTLMRNWIFEVHTENREKHDEQLLKAFDQSRMPEWIVWSWKQMFLGKNCRDE